MIPVYHTCCPCHVLWGVKITKQSFQMGYNFNEQSSWPSIYYYHTRLCSWHFHSYFYLGVKVTCNMHFQFLSGLSLGCSIGWVFTFEMHFEFWFKIKTWSSKRKNESLCMSHTNLKVVCLGTCLLNWVVIDPLLWAFSPIRLQM